MFDFSAISQRELDNVLHRQTTFGSDVISDSGTAYAYSDMDTLHHDSTSLSRNPSLFIDVNVDQDDASLLELEAMPPELFDLDGLSHEEIMEALRTGMNEDDMYEATDLIEGFLLSCFFFVASYL